MVKIPKTLLKRINIKQISWPFYWQFLILGATETFQTIQTSKRITMKAKSSSLFQVVLVRLHLEKALPLCLVHFHGSGFYVPVLLRGCSVLRYKSSSCISQLRATTPHSMTPDQRQRRDNGGGFIMKDFISLRTNGTFIVDGCSFFPLLPFCVAHLVSVQSPAFQAFRDMTQIYCWWEIMFLSSRLPMKNLAFSGFYGLFQVVWTYGIVSLHLCLPNYILFSPFSDVQLIHFVIAFRNHPISRFTEYFKVLWIFYFPHFQSEITDSRSLSVLFSHLHAALCAICVNMPRSFPSTICFHHSDESPFQNSSNFKLFLGYISSFLNIIWLIYSLHPLSCAPHHIQVFLFQVKFIYLWAYVSAQYAISCLSSHRLFSGCSSRCGQKEGRDVTWRLKGCFPANRELQSDKVKGYQGWSGASFTTANGMREKRWTNCHYM